MKLRFWGVRGSAAVPGSATLEFGGNTSCVELEGAGDAIFFDGGTGIRAAGLRVTAGRVHVFLTHFHWDHIQGIPFFAPLYDPSKHVTFYAPYPARQVLEGLMSAPYFPVEFGSLPAKVELVELQSSVELGTVTVRAIEVNHPQGACAYRVDGAASFVYAPDREHGDPRLDQLFLDEVRGATALVVDSQYTREEYETHRGWGHSTWLESARVAREAGVQSLVLFHHDPSHSDDVLRRIESDARREFADSFMAKEGWAFEL